MKVSWAMALALGLAALMGCGPGQRATKTAATNGIEPAARSLPFQLDRFRDLDPQPGHSLTTTVRILPGVWPRGTHSVEVVTCSHSTWTYSAQVARVGAALDAGFPESSRWTRHRAGDGSLLVAREGEPWSVRIVEFAEGTATVEVRDVRHPVETHPQGFRPTVRSATLNPSAQRDSAVVGNALIRFLSKNTSRG